MTKSKMEKANKSASIEHKTAKKQDESMLSRQTRGTLKVLRKNSMQLSPISISSSQVAWTPVSAMRTLMTKSKVDKHCQRGMQLNDLSERLLS